MLPGAQMRRSRRSRLIRRFHPGLTLALTVLGAAGTSAADEPARFRWDVPGVLEVVDVPATLEANGVPVRLKSIKSKEKPEVVLQHLVDRFVAAGLYIPP